MNVYSHKRDDFGLKIKIGMGNLYLTENQFDRNEMLCSADNHSYMCHICANEFLDLEF